MKTARFLSRLQTARFPARAGLLAASLLVALLLIAPIACYARGLVGVLACAAAALACLVAGLLALGLGELFRGADAAIYNLLFGMIVRMGLPLGVCAAVYVLGGPLAEGGFAFYLLAFYPVMLLVETVLLAAQVEAIHETTEARPASHG